MTGARRVRVPVRAVPRIALATCRDLPAGDEDSPLLLAACASAGLDAEWRVWDDPVVDWASYDLVVIRSTWDYVPRRDDFAAWAASVPRLANPADVVGWNTDKSYLANLEAAGVPVVPTRWLEPGAAVPGGPDRLLYARVDLLPGPAGRPLVVEVELTEPSLFLTAVPAAADRLAAAIRAAAAPVVSR